MIVTPDADLDAIAEEVSSELTSKESPAEETTETEPESQETTKGEEEVETFADKPDLTGKTPEELEKLYQDWQKAYTQKRQAEKEELRRYKEDLEKAKAQIPKQDEKPISEMTPQELQEHFAKKAQEIATTAKENSYIEAQEKAFLDLDKRLDEDSPEFDEDLFYGVVGSLTKQRELYEAKNGTVVGFDFVGKAKEKIAAYNEKVKQNVQSYLKKQEGIAQSRTDKFGKANPKTQSGKVKKTGGMDLDEAMSEAMEEVGATFSW
jgi:hypothetical protein